MKTYFCGVLNNGKDFDMRAIGACPQTLDECEHTCRTYHSCDSVMIANDILREYEDLLCETKEGQ